MAVLLMQRSTANQTLPTAPRVAVVGCGGWGRHIVRNHAKLGSLVAVVDNNPANARPLADLYGVPVLTYDAVLLDTAIQAVVLATPSALHAAQARAAILAGKDVYIEKPMALNANDAAELVALATSHKAILMVGHLLLYHPAFWELQRRVLAGDIGRVHAITAHRCNMDAARRHDHVLWDLACHDMAMVLALFPDFQPSQNKILASTQCETGEFTQMSYECVDKALGLTVTGHTDWLAPHKDHRLVVYGETGTLVFEDSAPHADKLCIARPGVMPEKIAIPADEPLRNECLEFLHAVHSRTPPPSDGENGARVIGLLQAISPFVPPQSPIGV